MSSVRKVPGLATAANIDPYEVTGAELAAAFDTVEPLTIGLEEEVMLLDPETLDLAPVAPELLARVEGDGRFKGRAALAQMEIVTEPLRSLPERSRPWAPGAGRSPKPRAGSSA